MGQKVNPISFRLQVTNAWLSSWYSDKHYTKILHEDLNIRHLFRTKLSFCGISKIVIDRVAKNIILNVYTSKLEALDKCLNVENIKPKIKKISSNEPIINIIEIKQPESDPSLIAYFISEQLEKRMPFRKVLKRAINLAIKAGVKGIRINIKGRLAGAEIARTEWHKEGSLPLHTIRAKLKYSMREAKTIYGVIGIKVWVHIQDIQKRK